MIAAAQKQFFLAFWFDRELFPTISEQCFSHIWFSYHFVTQGDDSKMKRVKCSICLCSLQWNTQKLDTVYECTRWGASTSLCFYLTSVSCNDRQWYSVLMTVFGNSPSQLPSTLTWVSTMISLCLACLLFVCENSGETKSQREVTPYMTLSRSNHKLQHPFTDNKTLSTQKEWCFKSMQMYYNNYSIT